jgi:hypothetical protein
MLDRLLRLYAKNGSTPLEDFTTEVLASLLGKGPGNIGMSLPEYLGSI